MAITLYQTPRAYINQTTNVVEWQNLILFAGDPCVFVVQEDTIGTYKFAYTCQVEFRKPGESSFVTVLTLRVEKNNNDCGVFDLANILQSLTPTTVDLRPLGLSEFVRASNSYGQTRLTFGSEQSVDATGPPVANPSTTQYTGFTRNGGTYVAPQAKETDTVNSQEYAIELRTGYDCLNGAHIPMTASVLRQYNSDKPYPDSPVLFVSDTDYLYIEGFKAKEDTATDFPDRWDLELYENQTLLATTSHLIPTTGQYAVGDYQPVRFYCCPYYMRQGGGLSVVNWPAATRLTTAGNEDWTHYRVRLQTGGGSPRSDWTTFKRYNLCTGERSVGFAFVNRHGATDFFWTRGKWTNSQNVKRSEFTRTLGNWSTATGIVQEDSGRSDSEFGYNISDRGRASLVTEREEVWTVNTGPLNAYETSLFMAMLSSSHVFANYIRTEEFAGGGELFTPVVIRTDRVREIRQLDSQVSEYQFELVYSRESRHGNFGPVTANLRS